MNIPFRIIHTAKSRTLPPMAKAALQNARLLHPEWELVFFDDDDVRRFVAAEFPQYEKAFGAFPRAIQRIDFFRYLAIYRLGGFYLDLDVFLYTKLDPLCSEQCVFPFEELTLNRFLREGRGIDWEIGNFAFGSAPGHPYLEAVIENCLRSQTDAAWAGEIMHGIPWAFRSDFEVLNTTGPGVLTRTLAENPQTTQNLTILFPEDVRDSDNWHQFGEFGTHLMAGSWRTGSGMLHGRLMRAWEVWTRQRMDAESKAKGPRRQLPAASSAKAAPFAAEPQLVIQRRAE